MAKAFGIITSSAEHKVEGMQNYRSIGAFSFLGRYRNGASGPVYAI